MKHAICAGMLLGRLCSRTRRGYQGVDHSEASPALLLHLLSIPLLVGLLRGLLRLLHNSPLRVVLLVDIACLELAIHGLALHAPVMLLLLHAATDVLLGAPM